MDRLSFTPYRKIVPTIARVLTEDDYEAWQGIITTPEGPRAFLPGDYLAKDAKGQWPIQADKIRSAYRAEGLPTSRALSPTMPLTLCKLCRCPKHSPSMVSQAKLAITWCSGGSAAGRWIASCLNKPTAQSRAVLTRRNNLCPAHFGSR
jgi:hypothetical protein